MRLEHVTSAAHPMYTQAMALYKKSFPPYEQREAPSQACILGEKAYNFTLVYDGKRFVGLVLYWETAEYLYIEHFCILPTLRNHHYGQRTLELLAEFGKTLIWKSIRRWMQSPVAAKCFMSAAALSRILSRTYTRPTTLKITVMPLSL